jgi:hypothetical protein
MKISKIFYFILFQILESSQTLLNVLKRESHTLKREDDNNRYEN